MREDIIKIMNYVKEFLSKKRLIYSIIGIFLIFGILSVIFEQDRFESKTSFITQISSNNNGGGGLKNIAALIGVNLNNDSDQKDLPIYLYPKLMNSIDYSRSLLNAKVTIKGVDSSTTLKEYYSSYQKTPVTNKIKKYTIGLPGLILRSLRGETGKSFTRVIDSLEYVSKEEQTIIAKLREDVRFSIDDFDGSIQIAASTDQPILSAQVAERAQQILQEKIIKYRIGRAQERYDFVNEQYLVKKEEYDTAQNELAYYTDRNRFNNTQSSLLRKKQLENRVNLAYTIYTELESQRLREQINVQEDTPVFTTIETAKVPNKKLGAHPIIAIIKAVFIGFICSILLYVFLLVRRSFKIMWKEI